MGGDLYEMRGEMGAAEVRSLLYQLTSAVKYLHDAGVWHRDIKSANTLCGRNRLGGRIVKICDFGLARGATRAATKAAAAKTTAGIASGGGAGGSGAAAAAAGSGGDGGDDGEDDDGDDRDVTMMMDEDDGEDVLAFPLRKKSRRTGSGGGGGGDILPSPTPQQQQPQQQHERGLSTFAREEMLTGVVATPCYRAPEARTVSPRTDLSSTFSST